MSSAVDGSLDLRVDAIRHRDSSAVSVEGYVLAGGLSRRMGRNKAGLMIGGRSLLERSAEALSAVTKSVYVVGDHGDESSNFPVIPDLTGSATRGAIVGLLTALLHTRAEWAAILACDLPFASRDLLLRLLEIAVGEPQADCIVPVQPDGRIQPLCGLYRKQNCLSVVDEFHRNGEWKLQGIFRRLNPRLVKFEEFADLSGSANFFLNVNTECEYQKAVELAE